MKTLHISLVVAVIIVLTACKLNTSENYLPEMTDIPFYDNEHVVLEGETNSAILSNLPQTAEMLHDYLQNPADFKEQVLPVLITNGDLTLFQEIDKERILIADQLQNLLFVVNPETMDTTIVAKEGDGPGDVRFIEDVSLFEDRMYVGIGGMKVSVFSTNEEVKYEKTINIGMSASSLAPTEAGILTSGSPVFGPNADPSEFEELESITLWSEQGEKEHSFGETYPLEGRFMLSRTMVDESIVRSIPSRNELMLSYQNFPILYRYNYDGELLSTYQIDNFSTMVQYYMPEEQSISVPLDDFSKVTDLQFLDEEHLLIYTKTFIRGEEGNENRDVDNIPQTTKTKHLFHLLNVESDEYSFLGEITGEDTKYKITQNFLLKAGQGELIQIQK